MAPVTLTYLKRFSPFPAAFSVNPAHHLTPSSPPRVTRFASSLPSFRLACYQTVTSREKGRFRRGHASKCCECQIIVVHTSSQIGDPERQKLRLHIVFPIKLHEPQGPTAPSHKLHAQRCQNRF